MKKLQKLRLQQSWRGVLLHVEQELTTFDYTTTACIVSEYDCSDYRLGRRKWRWKLFAPGTMMAEYWEWKGDRNNLVVPEQS